MKRKMGALALALSLALSLTACGPKEPVETVSPSPSGGPTLSPSPSPSPSPTPEAGPLKLTVWLGRAPENLDPGLLRTREDAALSQHLFEGLMKWQNSGKPLTEGVDRAELVEGQAAGFERTEGEDGQVVYTFHLREDAQWWDDKPVTAQDFVYAWRRLCTPANLAEYSSLLTCVRNAPDVLAGRKEPSELGVKAVDDRTFEVTLEEEEPWFLELCAHPATYPLRQDVIEEYGNSWSVYPESCVGNGPYRLTQWDAANQTLTLVPNDHYYDPPASPVSLTFELDLEPQEAQTAFEAGTLDFAGAVDGEKAASLLESGALETAALPGTYFAVFQTGKGVMADPLVREAFTLAVDRSALVGTETPAGALVPYGISDAAGLAGEDFRTQGGDYFAPGPEHLEANRARAKELLAQAGYPGGADFPAVTYLYPENPVHQKVAQALKEDWESVLGVEVKLQEEEWGAYSAARLAGEFDICYGSWIGDFDDPASFLELWLPGGEGNTAGYKSKDYEALLTSAAQAQAGERMELLHQAETRLIATDHVLCPLYYYTSAYLLNDRVDGVCYTPLGHFLFGGAEGRG